MTEVVILVDYPISPVWLRYLVLPELGETFQVTYIEIKITERQKQAFSNQAILRDESGRTCIEVGDTRTLINVARRFREAIVVDLSVSALASYLLLNSAFRRKKCKVIKFLIGILPSATTKVSVAKRMASIFGASGFFNGVCRLASSFSTRTTNKWIIFDYSVLGGLAARGMLPKHAGKLIEAASFDFLEYCNTESQEDNKAEFAVLIEENMAHDSDFALAGTKGADADTYFCRLSEYLQHVQFVTGVPIKVLPHPKSDRARLKHYLPEFDQINETSAAAINKARFVLTHASTAISFAILASKPIMLIKLDELTPAIAKLMDNLAEALGIMPYAMADLNKLSETGMDALVPEEARRMSYIDNFVRHPQAKLSSFEDIVRYIRDDFVPG